MHEVTSVGDTYNTFENIPQKALIVNATVYPKESIKVNVGSLEITQSFNSTRTEILIDGKRLPIRKIILEIQFNKPTTATIEYYPFLETK